MCAAKLSIPKSDAECKFGIEQNQKKLQQWLNELPITDIEKSTTQVLQQLIPANRCDLEVHFRIKLMHELAIISDHLIHALRTKYSISESPYASVKNMRRIEAVKTLLQEIGYGFKLIISKLYSVANADARQQLSYALFQTMRLNARRLIESYSLYEPVAHDIWGELNLVYHFAVKRGVQRNTFTFNKSESNIEKMYMQLLLLEAINPYRLMRGEAEKAYNLMGQWAHDAKLEPLPDPWLPKSSELVVDFNSGEPPYMVFSGSNPERSADMRIVNISQVKQALDRQVDEARAATGKRHELNMRLQQDMMQRLIDGWTSDVDRECERSAHEETMDVVFGIKDCHALFYTQKPEAQPASPLDGLSLVPKKQNLGNAFKESTTAVSDSIFKIDDPDSDIWAKQNITVGAEDIIEETSDNREKSQTLTTHPAKQINVSSGGFALEFELASHHNAKVGGLVSLRIVGSTSWRLCDIRWLRVTSKSVGVVGLRLISDNPVALICRGVDSESNNLCLLIQGDDLSDPATELLVPTAIYEEGSMLSVAFDMHDYSVLLTKKLEATAAFSRFEFRLI